ncbi:MAG: hypothetical protein PUB09_06020 [Firmicutes bacterium]|nr:hypothetical protein [Bacillota bacterium]
MSKITNDFSKFNRIREQFSRKRNSITNVSEVDSENGFKTLRILWLYPDVMHLHGGRGDVMGILHICNMLELPVEIKRWDNMNEEIPWNWPHMIYMNGGEIKCMPEIVAALQRQRKSLDDYLARGGWFITCASTGSILSDRYERLDGTSVEGLGLLHMTWRERKMPWGDDIWFKTADGQEVIGNQIQVADVELAEGQEPLGTLVYGRGNNGGTDEGARTGNVIFTNCLGPMPTKNPEFMASLLVAAADAVDIKHTASITDEMIQVEKESAEYIKKFMKDKMDK